MGSASGSHPARIERKVKSGFLNVGMINATRGTGSAQLGKHTQSRTLLDLRPVTLERLSFLTLFKNAFSLFVKDCLMDSSC